MSNFLIFRQENSSASWAIILGTSAVALSYNVVHSLMIQQTSAVTTTVIGQAKILGLLVLSATILGIFLACILQSQDQIQLDFDWVSPFTFLANTNNYACSLSPVISRSNFMQHSLFPGLQSATN